MPAAHRHHAQGWRVAVARAERFGQAGQRGLDRCEDLGAVGRVECLLNLRRMNQVLVDDGPPVDHDGEPPGHARTLAHGIEGIGEDVDVDDIRLAGSCWRGDSPRPHPFRDHVIEQPLLPGEGLVSAIDGGEEGAEGRGR